MKKKEVKQFCYIERGDAGVMQEYTKPSWYMKTFYNKRYEWRDVIMSGDKAYIKEFYESTYKDDIITLI